MRIFVVGTDEDGDQQMIGPFDLEEEADFECDRAHLSGVRFIHANSKDEAMGKLRRTSRNRKAILQSDEPMPRMGTFVTGETDDDHDDR